MGHFRSEDVLQRHKLFCNRPNFTSTIFTLPPPDTQIKFKNIRFQQRVPFTIYADCESISAPFNEQKDETLFCTQHIACSIGYKLVTAIPELADEPYQSYTGADVVDWFMTKLLDLQERCLALLFDEQRLKMKQADWRAFNSAQICYLCRKPMPPNDKVRDHDHITGMYRGAAHNQCNFILRKTYKIPVFFHNFRGYDSHIIVWGLKNYPNIQIKLIGQGMEKYLTVSWGDHLEFKDSYQFLAASLEQLSKNLLKSGNDKFQILTKEFHFKNDNPNELGLLLRKGVFPYEYLNGWDRFSTPALPGKDEFFNRLHQEECTDADYAHALNVWNTFHCNTLKDYLELYLKTDVLLLADVFEQFRTVCAHHYGLDPAHYVSSPQLSWDSMLKNTECILELVSDPEIFNMLDPAIRGGISMICTRYARANNPYMKDKWDPTKPTSYIIYLDANNLYGWAMSQQMPIGEFKWLVETEYSLIDWVAQEETQDVGYIIECDLDYPQEIHDQHNDYPLAPERMDIKASMLSDKQVDIFKHYNIGRGGRNTKLVPNLMNKFKYTCHYLNLKYYLEHGMEIRKIHRVLQFKQFAWLAPYITKNQQLRAQSTTEFEKDFFKLMNNSIYGKTCENQKKRTDIKLVTTEEKRKKLIEKPHCKKFRIFDENLVGIEMRKIKCLINKPFYVGFTVLELSKLHMYRYSFNCFIFSLRLFDCPIEFHNKIYQNSLISI